MDNADSVVLVVADDSVLFEILSVVVTVAVVVVIELVDIEYVGILTSPSKRQATQSDSATMSLSFQIRLASAMPHDSIIGVHNAVREIPAC